MISVYQPDAMTFKGSGTILKRVVSCKVKQELGSAGVYELNMEILADDPNISQIEVGNIVAVLPNMTDEPQAFVIESISKPINNLISVYATHIAQHRARLIPVSPVNVANLQDAITQIGMNSLETNPFYLHSSRTPATAYKTETPRSFREILGGSEGSLLDVYGGEYIFDNFDIELVNRRGSDSGIRVVYGQSMTDFNMGEEFSYTQTITGILPFWYSEEDGLVQGSVQYSSLAGQFKYHKTVCKDYSEDFETMPTAADLEAKALSDVSSAGYPVANIKIAFNQFEQHVQGNVKNLHLGDTVKVINSNYMIDTTSRVVSMTYDVIAEQYDEIQIGQLNQTINEAISDTFPDVNVSGGGGTTYIAGNHINITDNVISAVLSGGKGITLDSSGVIVSTLKSAAGSKAVSIAGNTDGTVTLDYPSGVTSSNRLAVIFDGYVPGTTWATVLYAKQISGMTFYYRTQGSTTQTYTLRYRVLYFDD